MAKLSTNEIKIIRNILAGLSDLDLSFDKLQDNSARISKLDLWLAGRDSKDIYGVDKKRCCFPYLYT